jgi:hypothetical protein
MLHRTRGGSVDLSARRARRGDSAKRDRSHVRKPYGHASAMITFSLAVCKQFVKGRGALIRNRALLPIRLDQWTLVTALAMSCARQGFGTKQTLLGTSSGPT